MKIRFVSSNRHKIDEVTAILAPVGVKVIPTAIKIEEIQTKDVAKLVEDKLIKAFWEIGRPLFVEHTGLYIDGLNGLPAGLTQVFWDSLLADRFAEIIGNFSNPRLVAKTMLGYCDGRQLHFFEGEISGHVPKTPVGNRAFQWDCVFIPTGENQTFAELGPKKNEISMRRKALDKFAAFLAGGTPK
jgi:XTP/dITP diphosphohydrolase